MPGHNLMPACAHAGGPRSCARAGPQRLRCWPLATLHSGRMTRSAQHYSRRPSGRVKRCGTEKALHGCLPRPSRTHLRHSAPC